MNIHDELGSEIPRILIAEDSVTQSTQLANMLEKYGYTVVVAHDGEIALQCAHDCKPTLLISDVMMPKMDGYALCKALKQEPALADVPVILVTELSQPQDVILGLECGADNFIRKPYEEKYLIQRLRHLLANRALRSNEKIKMGLEIDLRGSRYFVTAERQQILDLLISTYEEAVILKANLESSLGSLHGLYRIADGLNECATETETVEIVFERVTELLGISAGWMYLCNDDCTEIRFAGCRGLDADATRKADAYLSSIDLATSLKNPLRAPRNVRADESPLPAHVSVPIVGKARMLGVLNLSRNGGEPFSDSDREILHGVGQQIGMALERAHLLEKLETLVEQRTTELRKSERWFRELFQVQADAVFVLDPEHRIVSANNAALKMFGCSMEALQETNGSFMHVDGEQRAHASEYLRQASGTSESVRFESEYCRKSGEQFPAEVHAAPLRGESGETLAIVLVVRDISERVRAEAKVRELREQVHHAQRMESLGVLAGGVAHDMNNILSAVIGFTEIAMWDLAPDSQLYNELLNVREAGERGARLVGQILAFSRKQLLEPAVIDINETVRRFRNMLERLIGENIEFRLALATELDPVLVDESQIEQVLMNLVVNARDAMPDGGILTIGTGNVTLDQDYGDRHHGVKAGQYVLISVADTGTGMSTETQKRIFEPFYTTKDLGKGTGLGLSTVYGIVEQHGGNIWVYSEPGMGTVFKIYLPVTQSSSRAQEPADAIQPMQRGGETILLVEDDNTVRNLVKLVLGRYGYKVMEAEGPKQALELVAEQQPEIHLLVTDMVMPGMNGRELHLALRQMRPGLKALYSSGYTHDAFANLDPTDGEIAYLPKPFSASGLAEKVRQTLDSV